MPDPSTDSLAARFPKRAKTWRLKSTELDLGRMPRLMGIVNVTPDSFSDGGKFAAVDKAVEHALRLVEEGADILDIGGESTRPYSDPVGVEEELRRVVPVVERLAQSTKVPISIDTSKSRVAQECVAAGAEIINDVTGLEGDENMLKVAVESNVGICAMHMQGNPQTMQDDPAYSDVVREIHDYLALRRDALLSAGVDERRICLDPGIGFGKTHQHNLTLMASCGAFHDLACPLLVGHSRKGFLAKILGDKELARDAATAGSAMTLARAGIQIIRVHDVRTVREALLGFVATGGVDGHPLQLDE
ncbi:MAG: dihydropteroate synthase [Planctomycetota bacterium]